MEFEFFTMFMQLLIALGITLGIIFLSYKILGTKVERINNNKYVKVIERTQISKDSAILIVRIGKKGAVIISSGNNAEKISELSEDEIKEIEENKKKSNQEIIDGYNKFISISKNNVSKILENIRSKEEKHDK
ncbi:flagellar biosynthetic protein FliO [uncultured Clostridium sp.]|uniref:flagellar biosynthetic protein FliO n=1 Tax=uncultured Clostridium sp. TaxID=59620 RepID=UPI0025DC87A2|nr:flagellar biosynthetic protein FliO [uncultured Clostridium sp.]